MNRRITLGVSLVLVFAAGILTGRHFFPADPAADSPPGEQAFETRAREVIDSPDGEEKLEALSELAAEWATASPSSALAFRDSIKNIGLWRQFQKGAMTALAKTDPERVLEERQEKAWWPDEWQHEHLALRTLSKSDPDAAARHFLEVTSQKIQHNDVSRLIAAGLSEESVERGLEFAGKLSRPSAVAAAHSGVMSRWAESDGLAASKWLDEQEPGLLRDVSIGSFVVAIVDSNPFDAFVWASAIGSDPERKKALDAVVDHWVENGHVDRGRQIIDQSDLPRDERENLLDRIKASAGGK